MKKILVILLFMFTINISFADVNTNVNNDNPIMDAFKKRKQKVVRLIEGDEITQKIKKLEENISSLSGDNLLNTEIKQNLIKQINDLKTEYSQKLNEIKNITSNEDEIKKISNKYETLIKDKEKLLEIINKQSEQNKIQLEKIQLLLKKYNKQKKETEQIKKGDDFVKYYIFFVVTFIFIFIYFLVNYLYKKDKIVKRTVIYYNFFLIFLYTIFLVWFFFYLHPELSVFILFISGYLLAINAHLIGSFIGSVLVLRRFQIGDVIKYQDFKGQIQKITTINTTLLPITDDSIVTNKPIIIPNIDLLKNTVIIDNNPKLKIYEFVVKFPENTAIDIMKLVENIENNILIKRLNNRINTLENDDVSYKTSIGYDDGGRIVVRFIWKGDDNLNKQLERKIMGYILSLKKEERDKEKKEKGENNKKKEE